MPASTPRTPGVVLSAPTRSGRPPFAGAGHGRADRPPAGRRRGSGARPRATSRTVRFIASTSTLTVGGAPAAGSAIPTEGGSMWTRRLDGQDGREVDTITRCRFATSSSSARGRRAWPPPLPPSSAISTTRCSSRACSSIRSSGFRRRWCSSRRRSCSRLAALPFMSPYEKPTRAEALNYYRKVVDKFDL